MIVPLGISAVSCIAAMVAVGFVMHVFGLWRE